MPNFIKKVIVSLMLSLVLLMNFRILVFAQSPTPKAAQTSDAAPWYNQNFPSWFAKVYDENTSPGNEIFGERYTAAQVQWVFYSIFSMIIPVDHKLLGSILAGDATGAGAQLQVLFQSLISSAHASNNQAPSLASMVFATDRPLSFIGYAKNKIDNFSIVPVAHAQAANQGFGFSAFNPVQDLWRASRNFAYALSVVAVIALAFMIMFRVKISPQVVISVQSAIPRVVIALIFVTFSYAIAGLLVDLMYVVIGLIAFFLSQFNGTAAVTYINMTTGLPGIGGGFLSMMVVYFFIFCVSLFATIFLPVASGVGGFVSTFISTVSGFQAIMFLVTIIIIIAAIVVLLWMTVKILWLLIKTMAMTYLLVILGPLQIMLGAALPAAQGLGVGAWIKSMVINLAVYPVVGTLFVLSFVFAKFGVSLALARVVDAGTLNSFFSAILGSTINPVQNSGWIPPLVVGAGMLPIVFVGISFVMITIIPKSVEFIQSFLSGKPFGYGEAIGEALGPVNAAYGYTVNNMRQGQLPKPVGGILSRLGIPAPSPKDLTALGDTLYQINRK